MQNQFEVQLNLIEYDSSFKILNRKLANQYGMHIQLQSSNPWRIAIRAPHGKELEFEINIAESKTFLLFKKQKLFMGDFNWRRLLDPNNQDLQPILSLYYQARRFEKENCQHILQATHRRLISVVNATTESNWFYKFGLLYTVSRFLNQ